MYYFAKITGVIPKGMDLKEAPTETHIFKDFTQAKEWLLGEALNELPTPVHSVEITLDASGTESVWREYHWGHDALKAKNQQWWDARDPGRHEREAARLERKRQVEAGIIPDSQLSLKEQFEKANPRWRGPYFAWVPTRTVDAGTVWLSEYWVRSALGANYKSKVWFPDDD